jgi:hypothetical protein
MAIPVSAVADGVFYWSHFATFVDERYRTIAGVARIESTHPLAHQWSVDSDAAIVQLKSDTGNLPLDQLVIPGMREVRGIATEHIVLTWDHDHDDRYDPSFVQLDGKREAWRIPVASLIEAGPSQIALETPKPQISSRRHPDAQRGTGNRFSDSS